MSNRVVSDCGVVDYNMHSRIQSENQEIKMTTDTELQGTIVSGRIDLDRPVDLPDHSRVTVTVRAVRSAETNDRREAWLRVKGRLNERPIHAGGERLVRSDLYERD